MYIYYIYIYIFTYIYNIYIYIYIIICNWNVFLLPTGLTQNWISHTKAVLNAAFEYMIMMIIIIQKLLLEKLYIRFKYWKIWNRKKMELKNLIHYLAFLIIFSCIHNWFKYLGAINCTLPYSFRNWGQYGTEQQSFRS